jgi:tetratricopeptide (TPR) repeat protein
MTNSLSGHPFAAIAEAVPAFGIALRKHDEGDYAAARALYLDLVDQPSLTSLCLHQLGLIAAARGEHARSAELLRRAIRLDPQQPLGYHNLRAALERAGDLTGAVAALVDLGCVQYNHQDYSQAAKTFLEVLSRDPINYAAHVNLGTSLAWKGEYQVAARHLLFGMELFGRLVKEVGIFARRIEDQLADWLGIRPGHNLLPPGMPHGAIEKVEDALTTLGKLLNECGHSDAAMQCLRKSIEMAPGFALGHWNLSLALLGAGEFEQGWREYEWRWHWDRFPEPRRLLPVPLWRDEPLTGKRILVWAEQGFGDGMQFVALINRLRGEGAEIFLEAPNPLVRLFRQSFPGIHVIPRPDSPHALSIDTALDYVVPLMSLPDRLALKLDDLPLGVGYLKADPADVAIWKERLVPGNKPKVGVVWSGRPAQADDAKRSIPFDVLSPLFDVTSVDWYSLQVGPSQDLAEGDPRIEGLSTYLNDFADTAAAMSHLDLIISVCTGVAHLAGGLDRPTWLLAREPSDWRWAGGGGSSPWYPSMRIFRQPRSGDWPAVIGMVARGVDEWAAAW